MSGAATTTIPSIDIQTNAESLNATDVGRSGPMGNNQVSILALFSSWAPSLKGTREARAPIFFK